MSVFVAILLGIIQGLAEFLPISSSGHLSVFQNLFGLSYASDDHLLFDVMLHFATLVSICLVYKKDLKVIVNDTVSLFKYNSSLTENREDGRAPIGIRLLLLIAVGTLPLFFMLPFYSKFESLFYKTGFIGVTLILNGFVLYVSDKITDGRKNEKTSTLLDVFIIGIGQALAIIPGLSRAGTTITVGKCRNLKRSFAVKFSFLMSIPAVLGSIVLSLYSALRSGINWSLLPVYLIGMVVAGVVGYFSLNFIRRFISKGNFGKFSYYCWGFGALTIILSLILN